MCVFIHLETIYLFVWKDASESKSVWLKKWTTVMTILITSVKMQSDIKSNFH